VGGGTGEATSEKPGQGSQEVQTAQDYHAQSVLAEAEALQTAYVDLSFDSGYPTLPGGEPFWHKLEHEPGLEYGAFQIYLEADLEGPRELSVLARNPELLNLYSLHKQRPANQPVTPTELLYILHEASILYFWRSRARAHDLFKEAAYRHIRVKRQQKTEDYHYNIAEKLLAKIEGYFGEKRFMDEISPKTALDALKALVAIQRVSTGLPAGGPLSQKEAPETSEFEMILRQIGQKRANQGQNGHGSPLHEVSGSGLTDRLLDDPEMAKMTQELVIRVSKTTFREGEEYHRGPRGRRKTRNNGRTYDEDGVDLEAETAPTLDRDDMDFHRTLM
jgi:hypothetical protein